MNETLITMNRVGRTFLRRWGAVGVLESVTGRVEAGARIALVGPSGSGKSTLLHLLSGIDTPTSGDITWSNFDDSENVVLQKVGFVFQTASLFESLTVLENVELPLLIAGEPTGRARARALETLKELRLEALADKLPEELSGGQAQRVAVARAVSSRPPLLLMDEPTGQLDQATAQHLFDVLLDSLIAPDTALLVATHDPAVAERMDIIWQLRAGRLEEVARP